MAREPIRVPVYVDFASTLCYVAHRVMGRLAPELDALGLALAWRPIDLTMLTGWRRGSDAVGTRRAYVLAVAEALAGGARMPPRWIDSRGAAAIAIALRGTTKEPAWRERVWSAIFEEGRDPAAPGELAAWARDLDLDARLVDAPLAAVARETEAARAAGVEGAPTFLLDAWPMAGIQDDATMLALLRRFVERRGSVR